MAASSRKRAYQYEVDIARPRHSQPFAQKLNCCCCGNARSDISWQPVLTNRNSFSYDRRYTPHVRYRPEQHSFILNDPSLILAQSGIEAKRRCVTFERSGRADETPSFGESESSRLLDPHFISMRSSPLISFGEETITVPNAEFLGDTALPTSRQLNAPPQERSRNGTAVGIDKPMLDSNKSPVSRRKLVPGENLPRLASNWRLTTSSTGSDNPLSSRAKAKKLLDDADTAENQVSQVSDELSSTNFDLNLQSTDECFLIPNPVGSNQPVPDKNTHDMANPFLFQLSYEPSILDGIDEDWISVTKPTTNLSSNNFLMGDQFSSTEYNMVGTSMTPFGSSPQGVPNDILEQINLFENMDFSGDMATLPCGQYSEMTPANDSEIDPWAFNKVPDSGLFQLSSSHLSRPHGNNKQPPGCFPGTSANTIDDFSQNIAYQPIQHQQQQNSRQFFNSFLNTPFSTNQGLDPQLSYHSSDYSTEHSQISFGAQDTENSSLATSVVFDDTIREKGSVLISTGCGDEPMFSAGLTSLYDNKVSYAPMQRVTEWTNDNQGGVLDGHGKSSKISSSRRSSSSSPHKISTIWKYHSTTQGEFEQTQASTSQVTPSLRSGRRKGPLSAESKKKVASIRKNKSCANCRIKKISCTMDVICKPCQDTAESPLTGKFCSRALLADYTELFLPSTAIRSFQTTQIGKIIKEKVGSFTGNTITIQVSSGLYYPPIQLTVREFSPIDQSILVSKTLVSRQGDKPTFGKAFSFPVGLDESDLSSPDIIGKLKEHVRTIAMTERNYGEVKWGSTSQLTWDVYETIRSYQRVDSTNILLSTSMHLYAMQYFMTVGISIREESQKEILRKIKHPVQFLYTPNKTSRLINMQIKKFMCLLIRSTYRKVLDGLQTELKPKTGSWATCFCVIMLLRMCAEMVQTTTDAKITSALNDQDLTCSHEDTIEIIKQLDELPIAYSTAMFHAIFKTSKLNRGKVREGGFNPLRDELDSATVSKIKSDPSRRDFINNIRSIVANHRDQLDEMAKPPSFSGDIHSLEDHVRFRNRNSGRLIAQFLQSFRC